ncbi:tRNA adenosine(34) deaminase TadA [Amphibacillus xylanus]|uniref:tRNA-specific adenosine deaminase n=1 Tax=Amphibacillus xylanus (strain ATCC 51415 / DSM 6626 / JCM 7361 / LMG 17667 / NBRC 15112 / Ep01) TaxID=698758 RepID=K0IV35_AMPXN|nr:tRNA adenosine(34) deaminase TadA [Amphibacillus xylanus]BAM46150.1 putative tRNA-specific adenosine deaminase [Amphibacillus xylanus NBRC 15112]
MTDEEYMDLAIKEALKAEQLGEVPIGAVLVYENKVVARAYNLRETRQTTASHAEMYLIEEGNKLFNSWRLEGCTLYVTLEPCQMCAGAILQARIPRVVFGAYDPKAGCAGSIINIFEDQRFNHQVDLVGGVREEECSALLTDFFRRLRASRKGKK